MKNLILVSPQTGSGVNTIAVNLGIGLTRLNKKVILLSGSRGLSAWLNRPGNKQDSLLERNPGFRWRIPSEEEPFQNSLGDAVEYQLYVPSNINLLSRFLAKQAAFILCVIDGNKATIPEILACNQDLLNLRNGPGIDLIVPNKVKPGEWSDNSQFIFELADELGWEKIADPIPHCEAIHDLPKENQSVWELPVQYSNRKASFQSLVEKVLALY